MRHQLFFRSFPFLFLFLVQGVALRAQWQTLSNPFDMLRDNRVLLYGLDNRFSYLHGKIASIYGLYGGVGFSNRRIRFKMGVSASEKFNLALLPADSVQLGRMAFLYLGEETEMIRYRKTALNTYLNVGLGYLLRENTRFRHLQQHLIIPVEMGLVVTYDLTNYLTLKAGGGWRVVPPDTQYHLNGSFIKLSGQVRIAELRQRFFPKKDL